MRESQGMAVEIPVWVIQTNSGRKTFNRKTSKMLNEITDDCTFSSPHDANKQLSIMDFGYVVNRKTNYMDMYNNTYR